MKNSPPPPPQIEWTARFNNGKGGASIAIDGRSVFVTGEQARELAIALIGPARVDARASIVAYTFAEADRLAPSACPWCESLRQRLDERDATITSLRDSLVAANAHAAKLEREAHKDRASIVAFLAAEAKRRDKEARSRIMSPDTQDQLRDEAVLCRTLELAIERGDDLRSGECITIDDIPAADLVSIDDIGCVVGDMFTGFKQSIEAPSKTGIAIALHLGGWRVGMSVEEAHAIIARSGILLYEVTPIARATGGGE